MRLEIARLRESEDHFTKMAYVRGRAADGAARLVEELESKLARAQARPAAGACCAAHDR